MNSVNIFTCYKQKEDDFTNGLFSILSLSIDEGSNLVTSFLSNTLGINSAGVIDTFRVLRETETADAELGGPECCLRFETKIVSGSLRAEQIESHLQKLPNRPASVERLILLTPDDTGSQYIRRFIDIAPDQIIHISWRKVYDFLEQHVAQRKRSVFSEIVNQYLERIRETVFEQDFAGVIVKIQFGPGSEVYEENYLNDMKAGKWTSWDTPREYKSLDGTGRKLLLYHRGEGITVEVEIAKVERTDADSAYPWSNVFVPDTLRFFEPPIPLNVIKKIPDLATLGAYRGSHRNITHEPYCQLIQHYEHYRELIAKQTPQ